MNFKTHCLALMILLSMIGCRSSTVTETKRSGIEQLILSTAVDRSLGQLNTIHLSGKKVYLEVKNLETLDRGYVIGKATQELGKNNALIVDDRKSADLILEIYSGALSTNSSKFMLGLPEIPIPFGRDVVLPEIPLIKKIGLDGVSKLSINAIDAEGKQIFSYPSVYGEAYFDNWVVLILSFHFTDIPEME